MKIRLAFISGVITFCVLGMLMTACGTLNEVERITLLRLDVPTERAEMTVAQLMEEMRDANDPKDVFHNCKSYIMRQAQTSEVEANGRRISQEYSSELKFKQPDMIRQTTFKSGQIEKILIHTATESFQLDPKSKRAVKLSDEERKLFSYFSAMVNPKNSLKDIFPVVELSVVHEGKKRLFRLVCYSGTEGVPPYVYYIDAQTFLTVRMETIMFADNGKQYLYTADSGEYAWRDNVRIALESIVNVVGKSTDIVRVTEFLINPNIPDSDFQVPSDYRLKK